MWGKKCATVQVYGYYLLVLKINQLGCAEGQMGQCGKSTGIPESVQEDNSTKVYEKGTAVSSMSVSLLNGACTVARFSTEILYRLPCIREE